MARDLLFGGKLTAAETDATELAMRRYRGRTMENITKADIVREGTKAFCTREGVPWPDAGEQTRSAG